MKDIGVDRRNTMDDAPMRGTNEGMYYPSITLNDDVVTELQGKEVGSTITLKVEFKILGKRLPEDWDEVQNGKYLSMEVRKIGEPE